MSKREPPKSWSTGLFVSQTRALLGPIKQYVCLQPQRELRARRRRGPGCLAARRTAVVAIGGSDSALHTGTATSLSRRPHAPSTRRHMLCDRKHCCGTSLLACVSATGVAAVPPTQPPARRRGASATWASACRAR